MNLKSKNSLLYPDRKKESPEKKRPRQDSLIRIEDSQEDQLQRAKQQLMAELAQRQQKIIELKKDNEILKEQLTSHIIQSERKERGRRKVHGLAIRAEEENEVQTLLNVCKRLQNTVKNNFSEDVSPLAKTATDLRAILNANPQNNKETTIAFQSLQQKILQLTEGSLQGQVIEELNNLREGIKKEREHLIESLQKVIASSVKIYEQRQLQFLKKEGDIISSIPVGLKDLKEGWRKKEESFKQQIKLLQTKIISQSESAKAVAENQNKLIKQLGQSLAQLRGIYERQIQIPLSSVRESVHHEILNIKTQFSNLHQNTDINTMIKALIDALGRYSESKDQSNYNQMQNEIRKIGEKLAIVNEHSVETLQQLRELINRSDRKTFDTDYFQQVEKRLSFLKGKRREKQELELEVKCHKQKEYIDMLERYNKKLEQSVMRTQKERERSLYQEWKSFEETYRAEERELNLRLSALEEQLSRGYSEVVQVKRAALGVLQTENALSALFETFQQEIVSIQAFKDELFNFLENELRFKHDINQQVEIFNKIFVEQYSRLSELQLTLPKPNSTLHPHLQSLSSLNSSIQAYSSFYEDYESLFRNRNIHDSKFSKYLTSLGQLIEDHSKRKAQQQKVTLELDLQPMRQLLNSSLLRVEDQLGSTRIFKQGLVKGINSLKQEFQMTREEFQSILKFVRQSKLQATIGSVGALAESKRRVLEEVQQLLARWVQPDQNYDPLSFLRPPASS